MRMSLYTQGDLRVNNHYGYGKSFIQIQDSFRKYLYNGERIKIEWNSPRSKIQMYYGPHPIETAHHPHQFKIHMSQHESDRIFPHKVKAYSEADEAWTANAWGAQSMINSGVPKEKVFVYEHGLDEKEYLPFLRGKKDKVRFLHIDSGSPRKRSDLVEKAFNILYENNKNIELTLKYSHAPHIGKSWLDEETLKNSGNWIRPGTRHINETISQEEMVSLMNYHDVLIYPSEGEGFGMIPLEAMATGMPVISTHEWASYSKYFIDEAIQSEIKETSTNWGYEKVGNAVVPVFDSIVDRMQNAIDNIDILSDKYYSQIDIIKQEYTWKNKTKIFLDSFIDRVGLDMFGSYKRYLK
jgi:glycosyltransferase involved in cell wall biosynthesis